MLWKRFMDASCGMRFKPIKNKRKIITTHVDFPFEFLLHVLDGFSGIWTSPHDAEPKCGVALHVRSAKGFLVVFA